MLDISYVQDYFMKYCNRCRTHITSFDFGYNISVNRDIYTPFKFNVVVSIFDIEYCMSKRDFLEFSDSMKAIFFKAGNELMNLVNYNVSVDVRIEYPHNLKCAGALPDTQFNEFKEVGEMKYYSVPDVKEIIHSKGKRKGEVFTVKWCDDTETSVKLMEGDTSNDYVAFMYCVSIKMFGSKGECRRFIKEKKQVFEERVARRSEELKQRKLRRVMEDKAKREVPCAEGLRVPALCTSSLFKRNEGRG